MCLPENINKINPKIYGSKLTKVNLCYTNQKRKDVNADLMKKYSRDKHSVIIKKLSYDDKSQDMIVCKGLPLIARKTTSIKGDNKTFYMANNEIFEVYKVSDDKQIISIINPDDKNIKFDVSIKMFNTLFNSAYCITVHCSQGLTIGSDLTIHEWNKFNERLKYVSISRCKNTSQLNFK